MTVSYWQDDAPATDAVEVDVAIIGAGISGASVAWWLRDAGLRVALIDKGDVCAGASGRNAGFVTCGSVEHFSRECDRHGEANALTLWQMCQDNLRLIEEHLIADGLECGYRRRGSYSLAGSPHEAEVLAKTAAQLEGHGVRVTVVDEAHIARHCGAVGFAGGVIYHDDGEVHPVRLVRGIIERSGATVYPHHEVRRIDQTRDGFAVQTRLRRFDASLVVLATNGYSADLHPWFADKIYPTRGQILVTEPVEPFLSAPCYANFVLDYFRQLEDGRVLIGGFRQLARETEVGTADIVHPEIHAALEAFLARHFPQLDSVGIDYRWSGTMGFSADGLPLVGALPGKTGLYIIGGYTAHGIGWGFKAAQLLADLILEGKQPPLISARRFGS